ncbi:MAG: hypothetical protein JNL67_01750 [Planctomycetaceae bacterium]|nr:hypothetical protein [Planctomycetaceae bacterium]
MAGSEEHLFRQFRLPWVPDWVPDWLEAALRSSAMWKLLAVAILTVSSSYLGWKFMEARTGQESVDLGTWESRLDNAGPWEVPLLLDSLFQIQNDAAMALGVRQLSSSDPQRRQLAGIALRDADLQWSKWSHDAAAKQRDRAVRWLAQVVSGLHAPEQAIAVEIARQALLQPTAGDPSVRDSLLANSRILFSQAHPAHTAVIRWGEGGNTPSSPSSALLPTGRNPDSANSFYERASNSPLAEADSVPPRGPVSNADNSNDNRFRPAGFSRRTFDQPVPNSPPSFPRSQFDSTQVPSQIPLYDDAGRLIEVQILDPTDSTTPGGLIPVGMSNMPRSSNPGPNNNPETSEVESGYRQPESGATSGEFHRIGDSRVNRPGLVATAPMDSIPGRIDRSPNDEMRKRELDAAFQLRAQSVAAIRKNSMERNPATPQRTEVEDSNTEIVTSEPQITPPPAALRTAVPTMPVATAPRTLPKNPYRSSDTATSEPATQLPNAGAIVEIDWSPMSHIEVMFRLRDEDPESARQALKELERRGFNSEYIAVARRLTSPNPREREQLILDLVASHRIEPMPFLRWLANDPDPGVQSMAINALEMLQASVRERGADALNETVQRR